MYLNLLQAQTKEEKVKKKNDRSETWMLSSMVTSGIPSACRLKNDP